MGGDLRSAVAASWRLKPYVQSVVQVDSGKRGQQLTLLTVVIALCGVQSSVDVRTIRTLRMCHHSEPFYGTLCRRFAAIASRLSGGPEHVDAPAPAPLR